MKYMACFIPMLAGVEVLSLICLCIMAVLFICDIFKGLPSNW